MVSGLSARLELDRENRAVVKPAFEVIDVPTHLDGVAMGGMLPPAGTVVVYVGDPGAQPWRDWRDAARRGDWAAVRDTPTNGSGPAWSTEEGAVEELLGSPVYFEVRCAGRTLYQYGGVPAGAPWGTLLFPYTGGEIADDDFEIVEYRLPRNGSSEAGADRTAAGRPPADLGYVILRRAPQLSALEQQLLDAVDPSVREIHVGPRRPHDINCAMDEVTNNIQREIDRAVQEKHAKTGGCLTAGLLDGGALPPDAVAEVLGRGQEPSASVVELVRLRRRMLGES